MLRLKTLCLFLAVSQSTALIAAEKWIEPPMVDIPAGQLNAKVTTEFSRDIATQEKVLADAKYKTLDIKAFRLGKYEVTTKEFSLFIADTNYPAPQSCSQMDKQWFNVRAGNWGKHQHLSSEYEPVTCINWDAAQAYVEWLSKKTGKPYRLPSEIEWEYAARAGTTTLFHWGDDATQACRFANIADQESEAAIKRDYGLKPKHVTPCDDKAGYASVVGLYEPNAFGLYDMIGNIFEFTRDCMNTDFPGAATNGSPRLTGDCTQHMIRGGGWKWQPFSAGIRAAPSADFVGSVEGFRVAEDITPKSSNTSSRNNKTEATLQFERDLAKAQNAARKKAE